MTLILAAGIVCLAPLLGAYLDDRPLAPYLAFPPVPIPATQVPAFSWTIFAGGVLIAVAAMAPALWRLLAVWWRSPRVPRNAGRPFPWWGWVGALLLAASWVLAWNRFAWFRPLQAHTFTPLWLGYILLVNALAWWRSGQCWLTDRPVTYVGLFPLSAAFWWLFEYLNRYARNWHYVGLGEVGPLEYFLYGSLSFATVLPAVAATYQWLATYPLWDRAFRDFLPLRALPSAPLSWGALVVAFGALIGLGMRPEAFFPFVWVAPLAVLAALQALRRRPQLFAAVAHGDWRNVMVSAAAGLVCGFFWELWNSGSLVRWEYSVPYVQRFELFAMPVLGYAGYLPFGMLCIAVVEAVAGRRSLRT